jgi:hypothetical protein
MFENYDIFNRHKVTFHCLITLQSPLSHIGEVTGNVSNLKTLKLLDLEGNPRQCFVYSGNALRNGLLRRKGVASALEKLGLSVNPDTHHTMFAGGRIDGSTDSDMELDKKIRQLLPFLSVLGTAKPVGVFGHKKAQMVQGRINIGSAYLMCYESLRYIYQQCPGFLEHSEMIKEVLETEFNDPFTQPTIEQKQARIEAIKFNVPFLRQQYKSWTQFIVVDQTTRRDSLQDPALRPYLQDQPLLKEDDFDEKDKGIQEIKEKKAKKSDQMIASDRLIMGGSKLYSRWDFNGTNIEEGFIYDALLEFAKSPYLGGKGNRGNGLVSMEFWYNTDSEQGHLLSLGESSQIVTERVQNKLKDYHSYLDQYREFLESAKESKDIKALLGV